eukprot:2241273-Prymnesium_polylepis.1
MHLRAGSTTWPNFGLGEPYRFTGLWPMVRRQAVIERYAGSAVPWSGTRYVSMRVLIGSRRVPPT